MSTAPFCIVFYCGYSPNFNDRAAPDAACYGSELATKSLGVEFLKQLPGCEVHIFCDGNVGEEAKDSNGIVFHNFDAFEDFEKDRETPIDVLIVSRYIHFFLEYTTTARRIYLWMHDTTVQPYWRARALPDNGKPLLVNLWHRITRILPLSATHRDFITEQWMRGLLTPRQQQKLRIMGNGLTAEHFSAPVPERITNRFIYCSDPDRGLGHLLTCFEEIKRRVPDATLVIFYKRPEEGLMKRIESTPGVEFRGKVTQAELARELQKSDFLCYTCSFWETYSLVALEAQAAGCVCIASDFGALKDTIGDRGVLIGPEMPDMPEYRRKVVDTVLDFVQHPEKKEAYREAGKKWAFTQTWERRCEEWVEMFEASN